MTVHDEPRGIPRDRPARLPIGAALSIGRKGPSGAPIDKHRFFIVRPVADARGKDGRRDPHPLYTTFNQLAPAGDGAKAHDEIRSTVRGVLVHADHLDAWTESLVADKIAGHMHPTGGPSCKGDGTRALRWSDKLGGYGSLPCPDRQCPYRQPTQGNNGRPQRPACHPHAKLIFQLRMKSASLLCKFTSNAWETSESIKGFFDFIHQQAALMGVDRVNHYGLPFALTLAQRTGQGSRYSVVHMSPDFGEDRTLQEWLGTQSAARRQLAAEVGLLQLGTAATLDDDAEDVAADLAALRVS
jgi:hypothetical protein